MRRVMAVLAAAAGLCLAAGAIGVPASSAVESAAPVLVGFEYVNGPYAWVGEADAPVAEVVLDSPAVGDTTVSLVSSSANVTVPSSVTVSAGNTSAVVPVTTIDAGTASLTASLGTVSISATPDLLVRSPGTPTALSELDVEPDSVQPGETAVATVTLDFLAPPGGTAVTIASSDPELNVPDQLTVPADQHRAWFDVPVPAEYSHDIVITATLDGVSREATLSVNDAVDSDPDGDGVVGAIDRCPETPGTAADGCPTVRTKVELTYRTAVDKFRGTVAGGSGCKASRQVTVFRVGTGADTKVGTTTTTSRGGFVVTKAAKRGRYYAKAAAKEVKSGHCLAGRSSVLRVR